MNPKSSEVLRAAMEHIQANGWTQGTYADMDGSVCTSMAIQLSAYNFRERVKACEYLERIIRLPEERLGDSGLFTIPLWNDCITTTYEDVILSLKAAADLAEEEGD